VRRCVLLVVIACLGFQAGLLSLTCEEPCPLVHAASEADGGCPPLCSTCGCCTLNAALVLELPPSAAPLDGGVAVGPIRTLRTRAGRPSDIWHVPLT
jgi:hypothetical protein